MDSEGGLEGRKGTQTEGSFSPGGWGKQRKGVFKTYELGGSVALSWYSDIEEGDTTQLVLIALMGSDEAGSGRAGDKNAGDWNKLPLRGQGAIAG